MSDAKNINEHIKKDAYFKVENLTDRSDIKYALSYLDWLETIHTKTKLSEATRTKIYRRMATLKKLKKIF